MRLLTIDDSSTIRKKVEQIVSILDVELLKAGDGKEGLEVLEKFEGKIDLILLDWEMPVMDGREFLDTIKKDKRYRSIPVIMLSAVSQKEKVIDAIRGGAKQYVTKPFSEEDLLTKIVQALGIDSLDEL